MKSAVVANVGSVTEVALEFLKRITCVVHSRYSINKRNSLLVLQFDPEKVPPAVRERDNVRLRARNARSMESPVRIVIGNQTLSKLREIVKLRSQGLHSRLQCGNF